MNVLFLFHQTSDPDSTPDSTDVAGTRARLLAPLA